MRRWEKIGIVVLIVLLLVVGGAYWYLHSTSFQQRVQAIVTRQIEHALGTTPEIGSFNFSFRPLAIDLRDVVFHGRERSDQTPLARIAHLYIELNLSSLLNPKVDLTQILVDHPAIHVYRLADGGLNLPHPGPSPATAPAAEPFFDLGIHDLQVAHAELDFRSGPASLAVHTGKIPLEALLHEAQISLHYQATAAGGQYDGEVSFEPSRVRYANSEPVTTAGRASFTLWLNDLQIHQLTLEGEESKVAARARLSDLRNPQVDGTYEIKGAVARWGRLAGSKAVASGRATLHGLVHLQGSQWTTNGTASATDVEFTHARAVGPLDGSGRFQADNSGLLIPNLTLEAAGGHVKLQARYAQWRDLHASGTVEDLQVGRLVRLAAQTENVRAGRTPAVVRRLAGSLHGTFSAESMGPINPRLKLALDLAVSPPTPPRPAGVEPLSGTIRGSLWPFLGAAQIDAARLQVPGAGLRAAGQMGRAGAALRVDLTTTDLDQLQPVLASIFAPEEIPALGGAGGFQGNLSGALTSPVASGHIDFAHFRYGGITADRLVADATLSPTSLAFRNGVFALGSQRITAAGSLGLRDYRLRPDSPLDVKLNGQNIGLAHAQSMFGLNRPIAGALDAQITLTGTNAEPRGSGHVDIRNARYQKQRINHLSADLLFSHGTVSTRDLNVMLPNSRVAGAVSYGLRDKSYGINVSTHNLQLSDIAALQSPRLNLTGQADAQLSGSGTIDHPAGRLTVQAHNLQGGGESLGNVNATLVADGQTAKLEAIDVMPAGKLSADATVALSAPYQANARLTLHNYDADAFLRRFTSAELTGHSQISGAVNVRGPLAYPTQLVAQASFDPVHVSIEGFTLQNAGAIRATLANRQLTLYPAHIVGSGTDLVAEGRAQLTNGGSLSGQVNGTANLAILHTIEPTVHAAGTLAVNARLAGATNHPLLDGTLSLRDASVSQEGLPIAFEHIQGALRFTRDRLDIEQLQAIAGGGTLTMAGFAAYTPTGLNMDVSATGSNVRLRYQGVSGTNDVRLRLAGQLSNALLTGDVQLTRVAIAQNFDLALFIANRKTTVVVPDPNSPLNHLRLDVHIVTGPQVEFATTMARLQLHADLRLRGTAANPILLGRVTATQGEIMFAGNRYTVTKADVTFANAFRIIPVLDIGLNTNIQQYDITLNVTGTTDKLNIGYRSDPPLADSDIVSLLATGQTANHQAAVNEQTTNSFVGQSEQLLGRALDNIVASRLGRLFGITQLQVNQTEGLPGNTTGTAVTIQQQVSKNLKFSYTRNLSQWLQDAVAVDYTINHHLGVTLTRDEFGLYGFDFHFRHRAR